MNEDYNSHNVLLAFQRLRWSHTAENLANVTHKILLDFGIENSVNCITADNARVNESMIRLLESMLDDWTKQDGMIRCMAHTINLSVQKILQSLKGEATLPEIVLVEADAGIGENDVSLSGVLKLVRKIISRIRASNILWEALEAECSVMRIEPRRPILDMRVR